MIPKLQTAIATMLNPFMLMLVVILTYWACASISASYQIDVIKAECKQLREK
jgi:hypothetical protein